MTGVAEPVVDAGLAAELGLTGEEYSRFVDLLGREPTYTELGVVSALWSEHCSYKSSKVYLRELPTEGPNVVQGPGENAGIVDIGYGWVAAFKMESHNHPSFIEPYQGAATGVGASFATSSQWGRDRSPVWTPSASVRSPRLGCDISSMA